MRKVWMARGLGVVLALALPLASAWSQGATIPESALSGPGFALGPDGKPVSPRPGAKPFVDPDAPQGAAAPRAVPSRPAPAPRPLASPAAAPAPVASSIGRLPVKVDRNNAVAKAYIMGLQKALPAHGYHPGPATGELDAQTELAIAAYERDAGLNIDTTTVLSLKKTLDHVSFAKPQIYARPATTVASVKPPQPAQVKGPVPRQAPPQAVPTAVPSSPAPVVAAPVAAPIPVAAPVPPAASQTVDPTQVRAVQDYLKGQGFDVEPNGAMGPDTENAIKAYQASKGLPKDGVISAGLLASMGINP